MFYYCMTVIQSPVRFAMPVTVNTLNAENFRHSVTVNNHELFTDLPKSLGG